MNIKTIYYTNTDKGIFIESVKGDYLVPVESKGRIKESLRAMGYMDVGKRRFL